MLTAERCTDILEHELIRRELATLCEKFGAERIPLLFYKGTALAYTVYERPELRPRLDTDILIRESDRQAADDILINLGYKAEPSSAEGSVAYQRAYVKQTRWTRVVIDLHWSISNRSVFRNLIEFSEAWEIAVPAPKIGTNAKVLHPLHALLIAVVHPYMHHHGEQDPIWLKDQALLSSLFSDSDWAQFFELGKQKGVHRILLRHLGHKCPEHLQKIDKYEPSWEFAISNHSTAHETLLDLKHEKSWARKLRLLAGHVFPDAGYMYEKYGFSKPAVAILPLLYLLRIAGGLAKITKVSKPSEIKTNQK